MNTETQKNEQKLLSNITYEGVCFILCQTQSFFFSSANKVELEIRIKFLNVMMNSGNAHILPKYSSFIHTGMCGRKSNAH